MAELIYFVEENGLRKETQQHWNEYEFADLCDITRGASPRPIHEWISSEGTPWLKIADASATESRFITRTKERIRYEGRIKSVTVFPGDLILSNSATPGIPKFVGIEACIHDGWLLLRNLRNLDILFCYYLLLFERPHIVEQGSGTVFTNLKTEILKRHRVKVPPISEQRAIAHVLGTLDDKIELNRRMNETLEEMARVLFKSWFVDFDPVRAKAALRQHTFGNHAVPDGESGGNGAAPAAEWTVERARAYLDAMDPQIADLFPDWLVDSELGEIPEGWAVLPAGQAVTVHGGSTPSTKELSYWGGEHCFATPKDLSTLQEPILASTARRLTGAGIGRIGSRLLPPGTVLLSSRAPIGYLAVTETATAVNQGIIAMVCDGPVGAFYALQWTRCHMYAIEDRASGTTFAEISKSSFREIPFLVPSESTHAAWKSVAASLYGLLALNQRQSRALGAQRDALLPKLISGETQMKLSA